MTKWYSPSRCTQSFRAERDDHGPYDVVPLCRPTRATNARSRFRAACDAGGTYRERCSRAGEGGWLELRAFRVCSRGAQLGCAVADPGVSQRHATRDARRSFSPPTGALVVAESVSAEKGSTRGLRLESSTCRRAIVGSSRRHAREASPTCRTGRRSTGYVYKEVWMIRQSLDLDMADIMRPGLESGQRGVPLTATPAVITHQSLVE